MREIVTLSITSYRFSIGGEHYYGKLHVQPKYEEVVRPDGSTGLITRMGYGVETHPHDGHELTRRLGAKEAAYLNKKDSSDSFAARHKPGDQTTRFNDVDSIIAAAITTFPTLFDDTDVLMFERKRHSDEYEVLAAPDAVREALATRSSREDREEWLMANGYMLKETGGA